MAAKHFNVLSDNRTNRDMIFDLPVDYDTAWAKARAMATLTPGIDYLIVNDLDGVPGYMYWGFRVERDELKGFG